MAEKIEAPNECCKNCLKWERFNDGCHVFWHKKKFCTQRVEDINDWDAQERLLK